MAPARRRSRRSPRASGKASHYQSLLAQRRHMECGERSMAEGPMTRPHPGAQDGPGCPDRPGPVQTHSLDAPARFWRLLARLAWPWRSLTAALAASPLTGRPRQSRKVGLRMTTLGLHCRRQSVDGRECGAMALDTSTCWLRLMTWRRSPDGTIWRLRPGSTLWRRGDTQAQDGGGTR